MRILYLAHRIPYPPNKGDKIRSFHQIRHLSRNHRVHLACLVDEKADLEHVGALEELCASVDVVYRDKAVARVLALFALPTPKPLSVGSFFSQRLRQRIAHRLQSARPDCILAFSSCMAEYVRGLTRIAKVMDFVDVDSEKWRHYARFHPNRLSWIYRLEADRLARYEEAVARDFDHCIVVSKAEAAVLQPRISDRPISVIPNGVDLDYFTPNGDDASCRHQPSVVFTGAMDYFPNIDAVGFFCREIFPLLRQALPNIQFYIVGRSPAQQVRALALEPNVTVAGSVPDVRPYLAKARVAVAPLRIARGIQNKVLEAMAMGLPVVGTSRAFQGLQATEADGICVADDPEAFANRVLALLTNQLLHRECSLQVRGYVERCHRWQDHCGRLDSLLQEVVKAKPAGGYGQQ